MKDASEKLFQEAEVLANQGIAAGIQQALPKYQESLKNWEIYGDKKYEAIKHLNEVKLLLEYNADKSIKDNKGRTALEYVDLPYSDGLDSKEDFKIAKQELKELLK